MCIIGEMKRLNDKHTVELFDGVRMWKVNGILHREDGPAYIHPDGYKKYYINGYKIEN